MPTLTNSLGLDGRALDALWARLDAAGDPASASRRESARWTFRRPAIPAWFEHLDGSSSMTRVVGRNISRHGIGILHRAFIHAGRRCAVAITSTSGVSRVVSGVVARCAHRAGIVHEIGVRFEEPITVSEMATPDPCGEWMSREAVDAASLSGMVVVASGRALDFQLARHMARGTCIRMSHARDAREAVELARGADAVLADDTLPDGSISSLVGQLRAGGAPVPVIALASERGSGWLDRLGRSGVRGILVRPFDRRTLLRALAEFVPTGVRRASEEVGADAAALAPEFIETLRTYLEKAEAAVERGDLPACRTLAVEIKGLAPMFGFTELARAADDAARIAGRTLDSSATRRAMGLLIDAGARASATGR